MEESVLVCMNGTIRGASIRGAERWESRLLISVFAVESDDLFLL